MILIALPLKLFGTNRLKRRAMETASDSFVTNFTKKDIVQYSVSLPAWLDYYLPRRITYAF